MAARRAVLTGVAQFTAKISESNAAQLDTDIVKVSAHSGARPDHAEWQGKWYSLSGTSDKYPSLREATGYGTVTGLMGANCRHSFYPVIDGISEPMYTEEELANIDKPPFEYDGKTYTEYEATQRQRYMERAIRKTKRELLAAENTNDEEQFTAKSVLLRRQKEEYNKFSKAAGLQTENERTQVYGYDRSKSAKTVWAERKANTLFNTHYIKGGKYSVNFGKISGEKPIEKQLANEYSDEYSRIEKTLNFELRVTSIESYGYQNDKIWGSFNPNSSVISLYGVGGDDGKRYITDTARTMKKDGYWSTSSPLHTFRHELGHAFQKQLVLNDITYPEKLEKISKIRNDILKSLTGDEESDRLIKKKALSIYGLSEISPKLDEFIAECFAEYFNGKPRSTSLNVMNIILGKEQ